jgi:peptidoglycan/LPS O-acetylase OafA/YrhL
MDALMVGCLLALCWDAQWVRRLTGITRWCWPVLLAWILVASPLLTAHIGGRYVYIAGFSLDGFCIASLLAFVVKMPQSLPGRVLNLKLVKHVGLISYSLYLWQHILLHEQNRSWTVPLYVSVPLLLVVAHMSYYLVETPMLRLRDRVMLRERRLRAVGASA